ncbi:MAG: putative bicarbonate transporter, ICT family protein [Parcubacteria group bacterium GW2011_GWB1_57_6]|nr:MAG: putative bicarbonate transporter, ICT family protein [Parcubacteria group bacterium GW2011_GWB1_57_6]
MEGKANTMVRWVALGALFLLPLTPLIVVNGFFFPFITGKAFYLRSLIEIAVAAWAVLAFLDRAYRPRFSWIGAAVVGFVLWMFVADAFALNAMKAFWSNFERMEGWVLLIHLLGFFFAASAVLRVERKWRAWFLTSLGVSLLISVYALLQLAGVLAIHQGSTRIDASLGNSAYLAIYFLFSIFVALWLALTEQRAWLKWSLIALAVLEGVLIFFTETRGTIIGLVLALALAALLTAVTASRHIRSYAIGALALILVLTGGFYLARHSSFVQNNHVLQRVASISLSDGQTRFTLWRMAFEGVKERPLLGWGQEGFNHVFNKYYDPSLYQQEQWFDRAHNTFIDWLSAGGVPAFLLYLSLFGTAVLLLWRSTELSRPERIALTAAFLGYAVHNFFVFDNLSSYLYFFALLALVDSQVARPITRLETAPEVPAADGMAYLLPIGAVAALTLVWTVNITGMQTASRLITALSSSNLSDSTAIFQDFAAHPTFASQEIREQLIAYAAAVAQSASLPDDAKQQILALAIHEMQRQVVAYPMDARGRSQLAYIYRVAGDTESALKELDAALALSPKKEQFLVDKGVIEWNTGDMQGAQRDFNAAYELGPQFSALAAYAAAGNIAVGDVAVGDKILLAAFGTTNPTNDILSLAYYLSKNWPRLIAFWKARAASATGPEPWFSLAASYYAAGDAAGAIATLNAAVAKYPEASSSAAAALKQIREGK